MNRRLKNPVWVELPALGSLITVIAFAIATSPLPARVPLQFALDGTAVRFGSPWVAYLSFGLAITLIVAMAWIIDELWAKQETKKSFNWLGVILAPAIGFQAVLAAQVLLVAQFGQTMLRFSHPLTWGVVVAMFTLRIVLEFMRPYNPTENDEISEDLTELRVQLDKTLASKSKFLYWEEQNPVWMNVAMAAATLALIIGCLVSATSSPVMAAILGGAGLLTLTLYGGLRVVVTRERVKVVVGLLRVRVLNKNIEDLSGAQVMEFAPLRDFGGYGPGRYSFRHRMWGYFMRGQRGVCIETKQGKKYLLGSDSPGKLAAVIEAARGKLQN